MTDRTRPDGGKTSRATSSLLIGLLLVPLSAVAAYALVSPGDAPSDGGVVATTQTTSAPAQPATTEAPPETVVVVEPASATAADLEAACGADGQRLVEREQAGEITPLEQAALDALRQICESEGLALAAPPAPPDVIRTVRVKRSASAPTATALVGSVGGSDDDSRDHEDHDDDDHDGDDHDEDDHDEDDDDDDESEESRGGRDDD